MYDQKLVSNAKFTLKAQVEDICIFKITNTKSKNL